MGVTLVAILLLFGIHLLSILPISHGFQEKYIEFGLNITLASKQTIRAKLEAAISRSHQSPCSFRCLYASSSRNTFRRLLQMFLLLGGNIESNPGPQYKHPCGVCTKSVISYQNGIQCDMWSGSMQSVMLLICKCMRFSAIHLTWMCSKCGFPNFADSFFNDSIDSLSSSDSLSPPQDTPTDSGTPPQNVHSTYHENNNKYIYKLVESHKTKHHNREKLVLGPESLINVYIRRK